MKIGDFGLATDLDIKDKNKNNITQFNSNLSNNNNNNQMTLDSAKLSEFVGTPLYQSPEQIEGLYYNEKVDIYAMGLILYEMCAAFRTGMERRESLECIRKDQKINENIKEKFPTECSLVLWMTNKKPSDRPSAQEIIDSNLFKKLKGEFDSFNNSLNNQAAFYINDINTPERKESIKLMN